MIAEKAVLGSMLKENYLITESGLAVSQFADPVHKMIFQSMKELRASGKAVDFITLLTTFSPQDLGGANYVKDLTNYALIAPLPKAIRKKHTKLYRYLIPHKDRYLTAGKL